MVPCHVVYTIHCTGNNKFTRQNVDITWLLETSADLGVLFTFHCSRMHANVWFMFKRSLMKCTIDQNFDCIELHLESLFEAAAHFSTIWIIPRVIEHILHRPPPLLLRAAYAETCSCLAPQG